MMLTRQCSSLPRHRPAAISAAVITHRATLARSVSRARHHTAEHLTQPADIGCTRSRTICGSAGADVQSTANASKVLFVSRLDSSVRGDELTCHFKDQDGFESAFVMNVDNDTMGYVQFSTPEAAAAARKALDGSQLRDRPIRVSTQQGGSDAEDAADEPSSPTTPTHESEPASDSAHTSGAQPSSSSSRSGGVADSSSSSSSAIDGDNSSSGSTVGSDLAAEDGEGSEAMSRSKKYRLRMNARVKADPPPPPSAKTLFVPNLRNRTTEEEFVAFVRDQPGYESAKVRLFSGRRPDGYIMFDSEAAAQQALQALNGSMLNGKALTPFIHEGYNKERAEAQAAEKAAKAEEKAAKAAESAQRPKPEKQKKPRKQKDTAEAAGGSSSSDAAGSSSDTASGSSSSDKASGSSDTPNDSSSSSGSKEAASKQRGHRTYDLRVSNLAWGTTSEGLSEHFADIKGFVSAVTTLNNEGRASGWGYARFSSAKAAQAAIEAKDESELDGRTISVTVAASNPVQPGVDLLASSSGGKVAWALQVFNLAWETTEDDLVECFKDCQGYMNALIVPSKDNRPSGQGYVLFESEEAQLEALKAKQNAELTGRTMYLRTVRPGRVEGGRAPRVPRAESNEASNAASSPASSDTEKSNIVVLKSLPPQFSYREVIGLCSYFGEVKKVTRMLKNDPISSTGGKAPADEAAMEAAHAARKGQLCFVHMASVEAAEAVVKALDGHTVQGSQLGAWFGRAPAGSQKKEGSEEQQEAEASAAAVE